MLTSIVFNSKFHTYFHAFHLCIVGWELNYTCSWVCFIFTQLPISKFFFCGCNEPIWLVHCKRSFSKFGLSSSHCSILLLALLGFLFHTLGSPLHVALVFSSHYFVFLLVLLYSPCASRFSSSHCSTFLPVFSGSPPLVVMFFSWCCFTLLCIVRFSFSLLLSSLCCLPLLFALLSYFRYKFFIVLLSSSHYFAFLFALLLLVCCYLLKNFILPPWIPSWRN